MHRDILMIPWAKLSLAIVLGIALFALMVVSHAPFDLVILALLIVCGVTYRREGWWLLALWSAFFASLAAFQVWLWSIGNLKFGPMVVFAAPGALLFALASRMAYLRWRKSIEESADAADLVTLSP